MNQLTLPVPEKRMESAEGTMLTALAWIDANPEAWDRIVGGAQRDSLEFGRVRVKSYIEHLRFTRIGSATTTYKLPNGFSAAFTRILWEWHPELRPSIPRASSKLDGLVVPPRSYQ
jgi:hypothetical protein